MRESVVGALVEASMASSAAAAAAMVRVVPGSQSDQAAEPAVHDKTLTADEYAQQALEKLFASPLFASSVCSSLSTSLHLLSLHLSISVSFRCPCSDRIWEKENGGWVPFAVTLMWGWYVPFALSKIN
jgi:hypothetical protein